MSGSLKSRMVWVLVSWILLAWTASVAAMYAFSTFSQTSNWDDKLQSTVFQIWDGRRLLASTPGAPDVPLRADFGNGFVTEEIGERDWRVYSLADASGRFQIQVGNDRASIDADFRKHSLKAISLAALAIVLAGLLMGWSVLRALRPLATIEQATRDRSRFDLTPLPTGPLPSELRPLVDSFNAVLTRLDGAIQAERQFIGDAAHELRTPLSALQAQLEVALRAQSEEERTVALKRLLVGVQRSSRLSEQLLDMARLEAGDRAPMRGWYDLEEIVQHVVREFEVSAARQGRAIELDVMPCRIHCDVDDIGVLVRNLVDNSLRYTFEGGRVRISRGQRGAGEAARVFLEIADNGPGVPAEQRGAIFERFRRLPGSSGVRGSGIGLSLVSRIARMHRAQIETDVGFGEPGLCVRLLFPPTTAAA